MNGYQLTFYTEQDKRHRGKTVSEWLLAEAKNLGIHGATVIGAVEGFGHEGARHSAHFFELADQPLQVIMAVTDDEAKRMFDAVEAEGIHVFYVKFPIEFGSLGAPSPPAHPKRFAWLRGATRGRA